MGISQLVKFKNSKLFARKSIALLVLVPVILLFFLALCFNNLPPIVDDYITGSIALIRAYHIEGSLIDRLRCAYFHSGDAPARFKANLHNLTDGEFDWIGKDGGLAGPGPRPITNYCGRLGLMFRCSTALDIARANFPPNDPRLAQALEFIACMRFNSWLPEYCSAAEAKQAIKEYKEAGAIWVKLADWSQFCTVSYNMSLVYMWEKDYDQALNTLSEALQVPGKISTNLRLKLLSLRAHCQCAKHNYQDMEQTFNNMISIVKEHPDGDTTALKDCLTQELAARCMELKAWDEAIFVLNKGLNAPRSSYVAWVRKAILPMLAECYCRKQEYDKALPIYREIIAENKPEEEIAQDIVGPINQCALILHKMPGHEDEAKKMDKQAQAAWQAELTNHGVPHGKEQEYFIEECKDWRKYCYLDSQEELLQGMLPYLRLQVNPPDDSEINVGD